MVREEPWKIEFHRDERDRDPVRDFLRSLPSRLRAKVFHDLQLLEDLGTQLAMPHARPIAGYRLWELRSQYAGNIVRILYFAASERRLILLHGFIKKSQRTPRSDLEAAERRRAEFLRR